MRFHYDKKHGVYLNAKDLADGFHEASEKAPTEELKSTMENVSLAILEFRKAILEDLNE